ncbi:MAG TPA: PRC-barrel domain-containing protein [Cyclobacteriaceae bacterium]
MSKTKFDSDNLTGINHEGSRSNSPLRFLTASSIIGDKVFNTYKERLGTIEDIMIDITQGRIEYVVIELGGFLGIGEKYFAVPFSLLQVDPEKEAFILDQDKETLKNAPGFDKDHWPETNSHYYDSSTTYWGDFMGPNTGSVPY